MLPLGLPWPGRKDALDPIRYREHFLALGPGWAAAAGTSDAITDSAHWSEWDYPGAWVQPKRIESYVGRTLTLWCVTPIR